MASLPQGRYECNKKRVFKTAAKITSTCYRWQILIMAADHGGRLGSDSLRSTTEVILELTDINDNAPFLTNVSTYYSVVIM